MHPHDIKHFGPTTCDRRQVVSCQAIKAQRKTLHSRSSKKTSTTTVKRSTPSVSGKGAKENATSRRTQTLAKTARRKVSSAAKSLEIAPGQLQPFKIAAAVITQEKGVGDAKTILGRGRGAKNALHHSLLQVHKRCFQAALKAELAEAWIAAEERVNEWPVQRLKDEGLALFGLEAEPAGTLFRDAIIRFAMPQRGTPLPAHNLTQGDIVLLSGVGSVEGVIMDFSSRWIRIAVPESAAPGLAKGPWRMDLSVSSTAHDRCMEALESFSQPPKDSSPGALKLRKAILAAGSPAGFLAAAGAAPSWTNARQADIRTAIERLRALNPQDLNSSQISAVEAAVGRTLTLWQGPPGTGKTRTLAHFICTAAGFLGRGQILAAAASNIAVDNLVGALLSTGVRGIVRLGQPVKVLPELRAVMLEQQVWEHPDGRAAAALRERALKLPSSAARALRERALELEEGATAAILGAAQVIAATCIGAGDARLKNCRFQICALDEATQATEPASLVPLLRNCESAVLVGDQWQLPPTVVSQEAEEGGLGTSLFERLQSAGLRPLLLATQYRMHPSIASFPSRRFYENRLLSFPSPADRPAPGGFPWPVREKPLAFLHCNGGERRAGDSGADGASSIMNPEQAGLVVQVVLQLLKPRGECQAVDVAVITPYSGQVKEVQRQIRILPRKECEALQGLEVKSVDGFQGREKEVVIFSTVRSNATGSVGFLKDARRLNVALTRAKRGLVVIGNQETLAVDPTWRAWLRWMSSEALMLAASSKACQ